MSALKAIGKYLLLLAAFILAYIVTCLAIVAVVFVIHVLLMVLRMDEIPIVQRLISEYTSGLPIVGVAIAYHVTKSLAEMLNGISSLLAAGVTLVAVHLVYAVINLSHANVSGIFVNICVIISGSLLALSAKSARKDHPSA